MKRERLLQAALAAFHETKHGGTSHDQLSHGRWASGTVNPIGSEIPDTWSLFSQARAGGFTYEPATNTHPTSGYVVSAHKDREEVISIDTFREKHVVNYYNKNRDVLKRPDTYMGAWYNEIDGNVYLDTTVIHGSLEPAMVQARDIGELAIFDLSSFETIMAKMQDDKKKPKKKKKIHGTIVKVDDDNIDDVAKDLVTRFKKIHREKKGQ